MGSPYTRTGIRFLIVPILAAARPQPIYRPAQNRLYSSIDGQDMWVPPKRRILNVETEVRCAISSPRESTDAESDKSNGSKMQTNGNHSKPQVLLCGTIVWSWSEIDELRSKFDFLVSQFSKKREEVLLTCDDNRNWTSSRGKNSLLHAGLMASTAACEPSIDTTTPQRYH